MADLIVNARILEHAPNQFVVVVSTVLADRSEAGVSTDLRHADASTREEAEKIRDRLIESVVIATIQRGHDVIRVVRL
jgi:hypothetical protein